MKPSELMRIGHAIMPVQHFGNFFDYEEQEPEVSPDDPEKLIKGYYRITAACGLGCLWLGANGEMPIVTHRLNLFLGSEVDAKLDNGLTVETPCLPCPDPDVPLSFGDNDMKYTLFSAIIRMNDNLCWTIAQQIDWLERHGQ